MEETILKVYTLTLRNMTYRKFKAKTTLSKKGVFRRVNNCPESKDNFYKAFNTSLLVCQSAASLLPLHHPSLSLFLPQSPPEKEDGGHPLGHPLGHPCHDSLPAAEAGCAEKGEQKSATEALTEEIWNTWSCSGMI